MKYQVKKKLGVILRRDHAEFRVWAPFAKSVHVATPFVPFHTENKIAMKSEKTYYIIKFLQLHDCLSAIGVK